jgi:hypothetical protein
VLQLATRGGDKLNFGRIKAGVDLTGVNYLKLLELGGSRGPGKES